MVLRAEGVAVAVADTYEVFRHFHAGGAMPPLVLVERHRISFYI